MAEQIQFGADVNTVNVNTQGAQELLNKAKNVRVDYFDAGKAFQEGTQVAVRLKDAIDKGEANQAKADYLSFITSDEYRSSGNKADSMEQFYDTVRDKDDAYKDALLAYSANEYSRQFDVRNEKEVTSKLNTMGAYYETYKTET
jgi:hypothetical protein